MKKRELHSIEEADQIITLVTLSAVKTIKKIEELSAEKALQSLWSMKIEQVGLDPLKSNSPLNLIEQLNQSFTYIASAKAVKVLLKLHPGLAPFNLNLGTSRGSDIETAKGGGLAAEVFAAVNPRNNKKLSKDIEKVAKINAKFKYVFFMCPRYKEGRQHQFETRQDVIVWSVGDAL